MCLQVISMQNDDASRNSNMPFFQSNHRKKKKTDQLADTFCDATGVRDACARAMDIISLAVGPNHLAVIIILRWQLLGQPVDAIQHSEWQSTFIAGRDRHAEHMLHRLTCEIWCGGNFLIVLSFVGDKFHHNMRHATAIGDGHTGQSAE